MRLMAESFRDKVILVTGSTAGLGRELVKQFCQAGASVVMNGRNQEKLSGYVSELRQQGYQVSAFRGDVSQHEDCRAIIKHCMDVHGKLDVLVNNAGIGSAGAFQDTSPDVFRKVFEINTLGSVYMTRYALPLIINSKGSIVFISSIAALTGVPYSSLYSATKMALTAIGQGLEVELKGTGVHVGIAYVGFLDNGPEKRVLGPNGQWQHTGDRSMYRLQSMGNASSLIIKMIRKRKRIQVMSGLGKSLYLAARIAPWLVRMVEKRNLERARVSYEPVAKG